MESANQPTKWMNEQTTKRKSRRKKTKRPHAMLFTASFTSGCKANAADTTAVLTVTGAVAREHDLQNFNLIATIY